MPGIKWIASFNYDPFIKGANAIKQSVSQMSSYIKKAGGDISNIFKRITDDGQAEAFERKAEQIAKVFSGLVGKMGLAGDAVDNAKDRIAKALEGMVNSTERPKEKFRKFADELSSILNEIRTTEAPIDNLNSTGAIPAIEKRIKLENDILAILEKQKAKSEQVSAANAEGYRRTKEALVALEEQLSKKYNGAAEGFYSDEDIEKLKQARESVDSWAKAWENSNTAIQTCEALIIEATSRTDKMKQSVEELNNVYKGFADTAESTSNKIFISEDVFNRYYELSATIQDLKEEIKTVGEAPDVDTAKLQSLQAELAANQEEFRALDEAARHTGEVLGNELGGKVSQTLEKLYETNKAVQRTEERCAALEQQLKAAKQEFAEAKEPAAINKARQAVDELTVSLDKANDDLSKFKGLQRDAVTEVERLKKSIGGGPDGGNPIDVANAVSEQVKGVVGNIAAIAGIGLGLNELKDFFNKAKEWRTYFQDIESSMKVFLGSAEKGTEFTEKLQKYAYYNMFEFSDLAAASQQMISYGHSVESIIPRLDQLSNVATGTHGSLMELVDAYNRAKATGVVDARGIQSWAVKGVMIRDVLKEMGEVTAGTTVTFEQLNKVLDKVTGEGGRFHNLMGNMMNNISAEAGQLEDNLSLMFNEIGEKFEGVFVKFLKLQSDMAGNREAFISDEMLDFGADVLNKTLDELAEHWQEIISTIKAAIAAFGAFKAAMLVYNASVAVSTKVTELSTIAQEMNAGATYKQASAIAKAVAANDLETASEIRSSVALNANTAAKGANTAATVSLSNAIKGLTASMLSNPYMLIATAIAGIAYACYSAYEGILTQEKGQRLLNDAMDDFNAKMEEETQKGNENIGVIKNKTASLMEQTKAYRDLIAENELFAKFSKEEIANMTSEEINTLWNEQKAKKEEDTIRNMVEAAKELQQAFAGKGAAWVEKGEDEKIEKIVEKFKLLPEYAEKLKESISGTTNLSEWANQLVDSSNNNLQNYLKKQAEAGVVEGITKGLSDSKLQGEAMKTLNDYARQVGEKTTEIEKQITETQDRIARLQRGEEETSSSTEKIHLIKNLNDQIKALEENLIKARGEIGETFSGTLDKQVEESQKKVDDLEHKLANATGTKRSEIEVELKDARNERDAFMNLSKLIEAGKLDAELVVTVTRNVENAILGDEKLVELGDDYKRIDDIGQDVANRIEEVKKRYQELQKEEDKTAEKSGITFEQMLEDASVTAEGIDSDFAVATEHLNEDIDKIKEEQDGLKEKFGETYKDTEEYRKLELVITRKQEQIDYINALKEKLQDIAKDPYNIKAKISAIVPESIKKLLKEWFNIDLSDADKEVATQSERAQAEASEAQSRIDESKKTGPTKKTGAQWKKEEQKALKDRKKELEALLKTELTQNDAETYQKELDQINQALKKGADAARKLLDQRARRISDELRYKDEIEKIRQNTERTTTDAIIASIEDNGERERVARKEQHRRSLEDIVDQQEDLFNKIYKERKVAYENNNKGSKYENTSLGEKGWRGIQDQYKSILGPLEDYLENIGSVTSSQLYKIQDIIKGLDFSSLGKNAEKEAEVVRNSLLNVFAEAAQENAEYSRQEIQNADNLVKSHQSYIDRKKEIDENYAEEAKKIDQAIADAEVRGDQEAVDALRRSRAELEKDRAKQQADLSLSELKESPEYIEAFDDLDNATTESLEHLIEMFEKLKNEQAKSLAPTELKEFMNIIQQMRDKIAERDPFGSLVKSANKLKQSKKDLKKATSDYTKVANGEKVYVWEINKETLKMEKRELSLKDAKERQNQAQQNVNKAQKEYSKILGQNIEDVEEFGNELSNLGDTIGGTAGEILKLASQITSFVTFSMESIEKLSKVGQQELSNLEKASTILAIASAAIQLFTAISDLFGESEEEKQARKERIKMIDDMAASVANYRLEVLKAKQAEQEWFSSTDLQGLANQWQASQKALEEYEKYYKTFFATYIESLKASSDNMFGLAPIMNALSSLGKLDVLIENEEGKLEVLSDFVKRVYNEDLYRPDGILNVELAERVLSDFGDRIVGNGEQVIEELKNLAEEYKQWQESLQEYISGLYSSLSDDLVDSLWEFAKEGTGVMHSFEQAVRGTFESIGKEMIKSLINTLVFEQLKLELQSIYTEYAKLMAAANGSSEDDAQSREEKIKAALDFLTGATSDALSTFKDNTEAALPILQDFATKVYETMDGLFPPDLIDKTDAVKDAFSSLLDDPTQNIEEWGKNFRNALVKEVVKNMLLGDEYKRWLANWNEQYQDLYKRFLNGEINEEQFNEELKKLLADFDSTAEEIAEKGKKLMDSLGYEEKRDNPFSGLRDSFLDTITNMEDDAEAFRKRLEETMVKDLVYQQLFKKAFTFEGVDYKDLDDYLGQWNKRYEEAVKNNDQAQIDALIDELVRVREMTVKEAEELRNRLEKLSEDTTFKDLSDNFASALMDMNKTAEDWAEDIGRIMAEKIIKEMVVPTLIQPLLDDLQKVFNTAMEGAISTDENGNKTYNWEAILNSQGLFDAIDKISEQYPEIQAVVKQIMDAFGLDTKGENPFKGMADDFASSLMDMEQTAEDFANNIAKTLTKQMVSKVITEQYQDQIDALGEQWREALAKGDTAAIERIRQQLIALREEMGTAVQPLIDSLSDLDKQVSYALNDMKSSFVSTLMDMSATTQDFAEDISKTMAQAFIKNFVLGDAFDQQVELWQQQYQNILDADMDEDQRRQQLKQLRDAIAAARDGYTQEANAIMDLFGLTASSDQEATMNMSDKITYDQADQLLGINLAQELTLEQILAVLQGKTKTETSLGNPLDIQNGISDILSNEFSGVQQEAGVYQGMLGARAMYDEQSQLIASTLQTLSDVQGAGTDNILTQMAVANSHLQLIRDYSKNIRDEVILHLGSIDSKLNHLRTL